MFDTLLSLGFSLLLLILGYGQGPVTVPKQQSIPVEQNTLSTESAQFVRVVDGDTLKVRLGEKTETVRVIGIDTPEVVDPRKPVECLGKEASQFAKDFFASASGELVLVQDASQGERDKYKRLLRYVKLNGVDYGLTVIAHGFAHEYTYDQPYAQQDVYKSAALNARNSQQGLWSKDACK